MFQVIFKFVLNDMSKSYVLKLLSKATTTSYGVKLQFYAELYNKTIFVSDLCQVTFLS